MTIISLAGRKSGISHAWYLHLFGGNPLFKPVLTRLLCVFMKIRKTTLHWFPVIISCIPSLLEHQEDMDNLIPGSVWKCKSLYVSPYIGMGESSENKWRYEMAAILSRGRWVKSWNVMNVSVSCGMLLYVIADQSYNGTWLVYRFGLYSLQTTTSLQIEIISFTPGCLNLYSWRVNHCVCHEKQLNYIPQVLNHGYNHLQASALTLYITVLCIIYLFCTS